MKKAFTMIELVFVIVVIGILAAVILPSTKTNPVQEAAIQLVSHIRYTQHLAMIDDKFDQTDGSWYKKRWQIVFNNTAGSNGKYGYTIFSDGIGANAGIANTSEIAKNPQNPAQLLTGGVSSSNAELAYNHANFPGMKKLNLGMSYGITSITATSTCKVDPSDQNIAFDHLGRPIIGNINLNTQSYMPKNSGTSKLLEGDCIITLDNGSESVAITIKPETGYTYISG